jgi:hypothetical protein
VDLGAILVSNVNLLSRFLYSFKNIHLGSRRRFQIHAGFIFEDMVKRDLAGMGFTVTDIKRINRSMWSSHMVTPSTISNARTIGSTLRKWSRTVLSSFATTVP